MSNRFILRGELIRKMDVRHVGENGAWPVRNFVIRFEHGGKRHQQERLLQAVRDALGQLEKMEVGVTVCCSVLAKGRVSRDGEVYFNLDECVDISQVVGPGYMETGDGQKSELEESASSED